MGRPEKRRPIMNKPLLTLGLLLVAVAAAPLARADDHREYRERERHEEHYRTPQGVFADRSHHTHYSPRVGYSVAALPPGRVEVRFRGSPFFFHAGVWYRHAGPSFVVVRPPVGIIVPVLPPAYTTVVVAS